MGAAQRGTEWCSGRGTPTAMQGEQNVVGVLPTLRADSQELGLTAGQLTHI